MHDNVVALDQLFPDGRIILGDYKILARQGTTYVMEDEMGYAWRLAGTLSPGQVLKGPVQNTYLRLYQKMWRHPDPECRRPESWHRGHPENPDHTPMCGQFKVVALRGLKFHRPYVSNFKKRVADAAQDELHKRAR